MATTTDSVPDVAPSETPELRRASTAPTEESASGVGLTDVPVKQAYPPPESDTEEPAPQDGTEVPSHAQEEEVEEEEESPTAEYLLGIMTEFRKLEGKLSTLLSEHAKIKDENEDLRSQPQGPDPATLQDLETLTSKYNKVKKLYFQREQQIEDLTKDNEILKADTDDLSKEVDGLKAENSELNRDLNILVKERDTITDELQDAIREKDSLSRQRDTIERERDTIMRERDAVLRESDTIKKVKEEAIHDKQEAIIERDDARHDRENLQNRIKDLEDEVARLQAQNHSSANGIHNKRQSAPPASSTRGSTEDGGYSQEILKLKYDKVKRLYYEQQKTISHLEDRLRNAESNKGVQQRPMNGGVVHNKVEEEDEDYTAEFF